MIDDGRGLVGVAGCNRAFLVANDLDLLRTHRQCHKGCVATDLRRKVLRLWRFEQRKLQILAVRIPIINRLGEASINVF